MKNTKKLSPLEVPFTDESTVKSDERTRPEKAKDKFFYYIALFTIVSGLALGGLLMYWSVIQPSEVYSVENHSITVIPPEVKAGESVTVGFSFCKLLEVNGTVQRDFIGGGTIINGEVQPEQVGKTCINNLEIAVLVPGQTPPGEYRIRYVGTYRINPIKTVQETFYSDPFTVVK